MIKFLKTILTAVMLLGITTTATAQNPNERDATLKVGDPAPPIKVMKWAKVKGKEVDRFTPGQSVSVELGKVYAVEFWATWCIPCKIGMPHLSELARHYAGKVTVMSISVQERKPDYAPKVQAFVDENKLNMDYNVGIDDLDDAMNNNWMRASRLAGVPNAIVVTREGKVGWMGHPLNGMKEALDLALVGKLDEKSGKALMSANAENDKKWRDLMVSVRTSLNAKDFAGTKSKLDEMDRAVPGYIPWTTLNRYLLLSQTDPAAAHKLAEMHYQGNFASDLGLMQIANEVYERKDYQLALKFFERIKELKVSPDLRNTEMLAKAYAKTGNYAKAVKAQEEYIKLAEAKSDAKVVEEARKQLEDYRKMANN